MLQPFVLDKVFIFLLPPPPERNTLNPPPRALHVRLIEAASPQRIDEAIDFWVIFLQNFATTLFSRQISGTNAATQAKKPDVISVLHSLENTNRV
jgi:hypothetical protein